MRSGGREDLRDEIGPPEREFTLSTGTVLALFFGLALVCAVFFGFGYSMGRKSAVAAAVPAADTTASTDAVEADTSAANKPSAGSPAAQTIPAYQGQRDSDADSRGPAAPAYKAPVAGNTTSVTVPVNDTAAVKPKKPAVDPDGQIVEAPRPAVARPSAVATAVPPTTTAAVPIQTTNAGNLVANGGATYVQIAAVSHKEDADVLLNALKRRGYTVLTRSGDSDTLIHVQVGPFANKKDAEAMRQKLLGDGYNAILK